VTLLIVVVAPAFLEAMVTIMYRSVVAVPRFCEAKV
jgi:hypothetical protein